MVTLQLEYSYSSLHGLISNRFVCSVNLLLNYCYKCSEHKDLNPSRCIINVNFVLIVSATIVIQEEQYIVKEVQGRLK